MTATDVWISLIAFVLIYIAMGVVDGYLMVHYGRKNLEEESGEDAEGSGGTGSGSGKADGESPSPTERAELPALVY